MKFQLTVLVLLSAPLLFLPGAHAQNCDTHFFDRDHLSDLTKDPKIQSVTDILKLAPNCFTTNQAAVYDSGSLQCATPKAPRVFLYVKDENLGVTVCTFNSGVKSDYAEIYKADPKADCHESTLECEHFNSDTSRFEFYEIAPVPNAQKLSVSENNPDTCMHCHQGETPFLGGKNPRPNLENYPAWPGFYGSLHDKFSAAASEKENYANLYLKYKPDNARYSVLPAMTGVEGNYLPANSKPVVELHNILSGQNQQRVASEFTQPEVINRIWPFRYALLGALACDDDKRYYSETDGQAHPAPHLYGIETFIPDTLKSKMKSTFAKIASDSLSEHILNLQALYDHETRAAGNFYYDQFNDEYRIDLKNDPAKPYATFDIDDADDFWNAARTAYLAYNLGLPIDNWSMTFSSTLDFEAGARNFKQILPMIEPWLLDKNQDADIHLSLSTYLGQPVDPVQCDLLRAKSLKSLSVPGAINALDPSLPPTTPLGYTVPPSQLKSCIGCHTTGGHAPFIPFDNPSLLKQAFSKEATTDSGKTLFQETLQRIDDGTMPKNGKLSEGQKVLIKDYFTEINK